ncbi:MAG: DNA polymerase III subunit gamma/tau [Proteobacteria bacterium]|nr:DNA polymerase III subunit gamma/tau [Pseudomonadota bacterium]MBU4469032.1 DNA polymerase III subunit gamma/tau [Pseudomonadota bacterium]MCG2753317.1 DNA polymerase III subunit gamma/tau [Desulfobacteraceae bacterium]
MSYLVLARKYRPQSFEDVVGQEHVTRTLTNAISMGRVHHAVLFSGPRGTGKTTVARILAKALNCEQGPTKTPCNVCSSCVEITSGSGVDVFEIDGASNNSVDQVRELRDNSKYMPAHSRYKIYIIDEVHMLSIAAFNALLKILEEPPAHVLFFFATTEPQKIPLTILSRCQRHDFKRIDAKDTMAQLKKLCDMEGFHIDGESLAIIAREAGGGMRDALSLLDQLMASAEGDLTHERLMDILGVVDQNTMFDFSKAVMDRDPGKIIEILDQLYALGHDLKKFYQDILKHFRNLMVVKMAGNPETLPDLSKDDILKITVQVKPVSLLYLNQILSFLFELEGPMRFSEQPKLVLELAFIKLLHIQPVLSIDTLISKLDLIRSGVPAEDYPRLADEMIPYQATESNPVVAALPDVPEAVAEKKEPPLEEEQPKANIAEETGPEDLKDQWRSLIEILSKEQPFIAANLMGSDLISVHEGDVVIELNGTDFNIKSVKKDKNLALLKSVFKTFFNRPVNLVLVEKKTQNEINQKKDEARKLKEEALNHPLVAEALEIFKGNIVDVKLIDPV